MRSCLTLALLLALKGAVASESVLPGNFQVNGFGSVGLTRSSNPQAGFVRELNQPDGSQGNWRSETDTLFGLQANWQISSQLTAVAQGISRYHYGRSYDPELMLGFVRYEPNGNTSIRLGRVATDFYLYSDSRQVGYSYLTVRPSTDYFGVLPFSHIDGADLQLSQPVGDSVIRGKVYWGKLDEQLPLAARSWSLRGSSLQGINIGWQQGAWTVRASTSELRFAHNLPIAELSSGLRQVAPLYPGAAEAATALDVAHSRSRFHSLGGVYDEGPLQVQLMFSQARHSTRAFQDWDAGYLLAGYRRGAFTPFAGYSWIHSRSTTLETGIPSGINAGLDSLNAGVARVLADGYSHQQTTTLGLRWDFASNVDLKFQIDWIRGKPQSIFPYRDETAQWNGRTTVSTLILDFVF